MVAEYIGLTICRARRSTELYLWWKDLISRTNDWNGNRNGNEMLLNKKDVAGCRSVAQVAKSLNLDCPSAMQGKLWHIQGCSAATGQGIKNSTLPQNHEI